METSSPMHKQGNMENWKKFVLIALVLALVILAVWTRGSLGSAVCIYCLIIMGAALLTKRFILNRDENEFDME